MRYTATLIAALFILAGAANGAADLRYWRKSITYAEALWLSDRNACGITDRQVRYLAGSVQRAMEMPRFDYNPLPDALIDEFVDAANRQAHLTVDGLARLMERHLVPKLLEVLEVAAESRAADYLSEADRQGFLATKAKELGITLAQIEQVMNAAYIYIPVLTNLTREYNETEERYTYTLRGGIIWYHLNTTHGKPVVELLDIKRTVSIGFGSEADAYRNAADNFARNLRAATQAIPVFKLGALITSTDDDNIYFRLGTREGIHLDDTFLVGEWLDRGEKMEFHRSGWVKVGEVADNRNDRFAESSAWPIKRGDWAPGMTVVEHPRLGIDIVFKPGLFYTEFTRGRIPVLLTANGCLFIAEDYAGYIPGFDLDAHYNIARLTGVSQQFFLVGANFALPVTLKTKSDTYTLLPTSPPFIWGFHAGMLEKFYFGRWALTADVKFGMRFATVEQKFQFLGTKYKYTIQNNTFGLQCDLGLDLALTPDFNFGVTGGYRLFPVSGVWTQRLKPAVEGSLVSWNKAYPDIRHSGWAINLYIHYTPPALPFDPVNYLTGVLINR